METTVNEQIKTQKTLISSLKEAVPTNFSVSFLTGAKNVPEFQQFFTKSSRGRLSMGRSKNQRLVIFSNIKKFVNKEIKKAEKVLENLSAGQQEKHIISSTSRRRKSLVVKDVEKIANFVLIVKRLLKNDPNKKVVVYIYKHWELDTSKMPPKVREFVIKRIREADLWEKDIAEGIRSDDMVISGVLFQNFMRDLPEKIKRTLAKIRKKKYMAFRDKKIVTLGINDLKPKTGKKVSLVEKVASVILSKVSSGFRNYGEDPNFDLKLRFVVIPSNVRPKFEVFTSQKPYNCALKIIKDNQAHSRKSYTKIIDDCNEKLQQSGSGFTNEIMDELLPKLEVGVCLVDMMKNKIKTYVSRKTNKMIYLLVHNNHVTKVPVEFIKNKRRMVFKTLSKSRIRAIKTDTMSMYNIYNHLCLLDPIKNIMYKSYKSKFGFKNAVSENQDYRLEYVSKSKLPWFKDNHFRRKAVPNPIDISLAYPEESDICIDKCNSYRSAYFYMRSLGRKYPTILQKYEVDDQQLALTAIKKYEGMAFVTFHKCVDTCILSLKILLKGDGYYTFPTLRHFIKKNVNFSIKQIAYSKLGSDYMHPDLLSANNNLKFNKFNGNMLPTRRVRKITKNLDSKDEFLQILDYLGDKNYSIKNIEFGTLLEHHDYRINNTCSNEHVSVNGDFFEECSDVILPSLTEYSVEFLEKKINRYQRPLLYAYNLSYQQIQMAIFIENMKITEDNLVSIRTDGIRMKKITEEIKNNECIISHTVKRQLNASQRMDKWQFEFGKYGFKDLFTMQKKNQQLKYKFPLKLTKDCLRPARLFLSGIGGTGKSKLMSEIGKKLDGTVYTSSTIRSAIKFVDGRTIQSFMGYIPDKKTKIWGFRDYFIKNITNELVIDESIRLSSTFLDKIIEEFPFTNITLIGDKYQGLAINEKSIFRSKHWKSFSTEIIPDKDCKRYINSDKTINTAYRDLIIQIKNDINQDEDGSVIYKRDKTRQYIDNLRKKSKLFDSMFVAHMCVHTCDEKNITLTPTNIQCACLNKHAKSNSITISKCQGLEFGLDKKITVVLDKIISIRDLYVACSRVRNEKSLSLLI